MKRMMGTRLAGLVAVSVAVTALSGCFGQNERNELKIRLKHSGLVEGQYRVEEQGTAREFLGIPYAEAPVGALRFQPPKPVKPWRGSKLAQSLGASCVQNPGALSAPGAQSEDCLTLNVYAPAGAGHSAKLPVMVFIHGGAFVAGGSSQYDGWRLAQEYGTVVVTLNYRLGALGFLSMPELDAELDTPESGNAGFLDQRLALEWVQDNIRSFGGDPENVTLFGESAGSMSTCVQMVAPGSQGLADRYILQSGTCVGGLPITGKEQANAIGAALADAFCADAVDKLDCLRQVPAAELVAWGADAGITGAGWGPVVSTGSTVLPDQPINLIQSGQFNQGPVIVGSNAREWGLFQLVGAGVTVTTIDEFNAEIDAVYPPQLAVPIKQVYAPASDAQANGKLVDVLTDQLFRCPSRTLARAVQRMGSEVWLYSFEEGAAFHAMELPYVFGNPSATLAPVLVEPLRETVQSYWSSFAASGNPNQGNPNGSGQPEWPTYEAGSDQHMSLKAVSEVGNGLAQTTCDFWDGVAAAASGL